MGDATRREAGDVIYAAKLREFKTLGAVLGYFYEGDLILDDGTPAPLLNAMIYRPSAHPGCLAPHLWLADGTSLYDHFGQEFTLLLTGEDSVAEREQVGAAAATVGVDVKVIAPGDYRLPHRYAAGYALIRPDQHVAWRGNTLPTDFAQVLRVVTGN